MKILIVGCGKVGRTIAEQLDGEGHNITVVDTNSAAVSRVTDHLDVMGIEGDGASRETLEEAGVESADLVIAVADADELNLYICLISHIAGAKNTIARVRKPVYSKDIGENTELRKSIGLSLMINPEKIAAREISRLVRFPAAIEVDSFARGNAELYTLKLPEKHPIIGKKIVDVDTFKADIFRSAARLCIVERGSDVFIPDGNFVCAAGDKVSLICTPSKADSMFKKFNGLAAGGAKNVMIIGGSKTAYYLAEILLDSNCNVKLIEKDTHRAHELSDLLPKANVINEDALNEDMLMREGIEKMEAVVTLMNLDEENIMLSLYVRQNTKAKCITKVERIVFDKIVDTMPLDSVIRPRELTAEAIVRYVRAVKNSEGSNVESLYKLCDGKAEALEFRVTSKNTRIIGHQLQTIKFKKNLQIGCIKRRGRVIIPKGQDTIEPEDFVVVVTTHKGLQRIEDVLAD
ncbi:MAG: Trk system potassium transporter TrkA [Clostridia bacterium]|nr:Trk system potassium transporter TrkA [Clostridia bacterium]